MITLVAFNREEYEEKRIATLEDHLRNSQDHPDKKSESVAQVYDNGIKVYLQMDTGSASNLKPELVMEAFSEYLNVEYNKYAWQSHRIEVYTRDTETGKLAALDQVDK
jgi:hypothetical protein